MKGGECMYPNLLAVLVAGIINMAIGFFWYGNMLFAKQWMKLNNIDPKAMKNANKQMGKMYTMMFVSALVSGFILGWFDLKLGANSITRGAMIGLMAWLGFTATSQFAMWIFSGKKVQAFYIDAGYYLVVYLINGALLALWR